MSTAFGEVSDLRKLIKYEENLGANVNQDDYFESLFRRTTASYRAKVDRENAARKLREEEESERRKERSREKRYKKKSPHRRLPMAATADHISSTDQENVAPALLRRPRNKDDAPIMVIDSKVTATDVQLTQGINEAFSEKLKISPCIYTAKDRPLGENIQLATSSKATKSKEKKKDDGAACGSRKSDYLPPMKSKSSAVSPLRSVGSTSTTTKISPGFLTQRQRKPPLQKSDPVALYQYYQNQWKIFRQQIPGDNSHASLRWQIRHKMLDSEP